MSIGPVNDWNSSFADVGSVAPIAGAEGLWAGVIFVFGIWFVIACYRIGVQQATDNSEEFSNAGILLRLLAFMEGQTAEETKDRA